MISEAKTVGAASQATEPVRRCGGREPGAGCGRGRRGQPGQSSGVPALFISVLVLALSRVQMLVGQSLQPLAW